MSLKENWTRDAAGNYVDWTKPPYRQPGSGVVRLVLEGEDYEKLSSETRRQRIMELQALERRGEKKRD